MLLGYFDVFPEKCDSEMRVAYVLDDDMRMPPGSYVFTEYYCPDLSCDCKRVLIKVLHISGPEAKPKDVATISYTWDQAGYWLWMGRKDDEANPFLDPLHPQASCATELLEFWREMLRKDRKYARRLRTHYDELRRAHGQVGGMESDQSLMTAQIAESPAEKKRRYRALRQRSQNQRHGRGRK